MELDLSWLQIANGVLTYDGDTIRVADISSTATTQRRVPEKEDGIASENYWLLPIFAVGSWAAILFTEWPIVVKVFLIVWALGSTIGLLMIPFAKKKVRNYNKSRPSYPVLVLYFRGNRESREIDLYSKAAAASPPESVHQITANVERISGVLVQSMQDT